jgi:aspartate aminotransferase
VHHSLAKRLEAAEESATVRISQIAKELKAKGEDVVALAAGEPDFPTPAPIVEAAKQALDKGDTKYAPSFGYPSLRAGVAEWLEKRYGSPARAENVLITPTKHAVFMTVFSLLDPGDEVAIPDPGWVTYEACVGLAGGKVKRYACPDGKFIDVESLKNAVSKRTKLVIMGSPSNPTGMVASKAEAKAVADIVSDSSSYLLSDEIYECLVYEGAHTAMATLPGMWDRTVTVSGFSKTWSMTGWRVGWLVAPKEIVAAANKVQQATLTCVPGFVQRAAERALKEELTVETMRRAFLKRRDLVLSLLSGIKGLECPKPTGAFYVFPSYSSPKLASVEVAERLLTEAKVAITPGAAFGPGGEGHLRISYAASEEDLRRGCARLAEWFAKCG